MAMGHYGYSARTYHYYLTTRLGQYSKKTSLLLTIIIIILKKNNNNNNNNNNIADIIIAPLNEIPNIPLKVMKIKLIQCHTKYTVLKGTSKQQLKQLLQCVSS